MLQSDYGVLFDMKKCLIWRCIDGCLNIPFPVLQKLLSTEEDRSGGNETPKRKLSETNDSLIHRLLEDEQKQRECTSAPAVSSWFSLEF